MVASTATTDPESVTPRRHLLAVWNPVLASDAMEQHIRMLQDAARKLNSGEMLE